MTLVRNTLEGSTGEGILKDIADSVNGAYRGLADEVTGVYHATDDVVVGGAGAVVPPTDLPEALVALNELAVLFIKHLADGVRHKTASAEEIAAPFATDLATAQTLANEWKADFNTHLTEATVHFNNDGVNTIAAADASNLATLLTLLTECQTDWDLHAAGSALSSPPSVGDVLEIVEP